jgi:hemin uptake protein HemP
MGKSRLDPPGTENDPQNGTTQARPTESAAVATIDSRALLQGGSLAYIVHNGELYRLRVTKQGKLILTK